jgi:hypothetical protein
MAKVLRALLEVVGLAVDSSFFGRSGNLYVAAHTKVSCHARPQHGSAAAGENHSVNWINLPLGST